MEPKTKSIKRYLCFAKSAADYESEMYKFCLHALKSGKYVHLITNHYTKELANAFKEDEPLFRCQLKRFVISKIPAIDQVRRKLLQLRKWVILPDLVVIDLYSYMTEMRCKSSKHKNLPLKSPMLHIAQCATALGEYLNVLQRRKIHKANKKIQVLGPVIPGVCRIPMKRQKRFDDNEPPLNILNTLWQKMFQPCLKMTNDNDKKVMQMKKSTKLCIDVIVTFTIDGEPFTQAQYNTLIHLYFYAYKTFNDFTLLSQYIKKPVILSASQSLEANKQNFSDDTSNFSDLAIPEMETE